MTSNRPEGIEGRRSPVALSADEFRAIGHRLVDDLAQFLDALPEGPVSRNDSADALRDLLGNARGLPEHGEDPAALLSTTARMLFDHSLFNGHPRFLGYITSSPTPIGMLGDLLASGINANVGAWRLSPLASEIETQTVRWMAELAGYPVDCAGLLVSGGNMANMVALLAARRAAADWDLRAGGVRPDGAPRLRVLATREAHTWLQKAMDMAGLGTESIVWIPTDSRQRMDPDALRRTLSGFRGSDEIPMMVVTTAGTVSTGAIDPLREIAQLCEDHGVWMHVDGCYGGFAACAAGAPEDLLELRRADSVALDPHKWLYAPLEAGALLVRKAEHLTDAFSYHPPYYHFTNEGVNYVDYGLQNSRGFRALKVWLALRQAGRSGYAEMIGEDIRLARWLADRIEEHPELELLGCELSITTFRYVPRGARLDDAQLDALNKNLLEKIQRSGEAFVSNAVIEGRYALRSCIVNFHTDEASLARVIDIVLELGRSIQAGR